MTIGFSHDWLTFTKRTAVVSKTLLTLLPPSQLFVTDPLPGILAPVPDTVKPAAPQLLHFIIWYLTVKQLLLLSQAYVQDCKMEQLRCSKMLYSVSFAIGAIAC